MIKVFAAIIIVIVFLTSVGCDNHKYKYVCYSQEFYGYPDDQQKQELLTDSLYHSGDKTYMRTNYGDYCIFTVDSCYIIKY